MGDSNRNLLMAAKHDLGPFVPAMVDDGVMQGPKARPRIECSVFEAIALHQVNDEIRTILWTLHLFFYLASPPLRRRCTIANSTLAQKRGPNVFYKTVAD